MQATLPFHVYDVFTDRAYAGNPLAIVEEASGLSDVQMLAMARQFNLSETIFVSPPADPAHDASVRIFFPTAEIPFAGHPTLGCAVHLALAGRGPEDFEARVVLEEVAGRVPVDLVRRRGTVTGWLDAPILPERTGAAEVAACAAALGLSESEIGWGAQVPSVWQGGPAFLYVPVATRGILGRARPQEPAWSALMTTAGVDSAYLYTPDYAARMFSPAAGIPEDPATGSATAILSGPLLAGGVLGEGETEIALVQGVEMGRPSRLGLRATVTEGRLCRVRVGGSAVPVASGRIRPPEM